MIRSVLAVTADYPTLKAPHRGTFVRQAVEAIRRQGVDCMVIKPIAFHRALLGKARPVRFGAKISGERDSYPFEPKYFSYGYRPFYGFNFASWTQRSFERAAMSAAKVLAKPEVVYGHFAYAGGAAAVAVGRFWNVPAIVGVGESQWEYVEILGRERVRGMYAGAAGVIAVSRILAQRLIDEGFVTQDRVAVIPNGVDLQKFVPGDRARLRQEFGLPHEKFIVVFTGRLTRAKGVLALIEAVSGLEGVHLLLVGPGEKPVEREWLSAVGPVSHAEVPKYLAAANVFALPSHSEGCSNALLEALACGLPVVTSEGRFNDDIVNDAVAVRINPHDPIAIREAIRQLQENPIRCQAMGERARLWGEGFDIDTRAKRILDFMQHTREDYYGNLLQSTNTFNSS